MLNGNQTKSFECQGNVKVSQGQIPDALETLNNRIERLEGFAHDIIDLLVMPKPVEASCGKEPVPPYLTLAEQIREADNRITRVLNDMEVIRGVLTDQLGHNTKLV